MGIAFLQALVHRASDLYPLAGLFIVGITHSIFVISTVQLMIDRSLTLCTHTITYSIVVRQVVENSQ